MSHVHTDKNGFPLQRRHEAHGGARNPVEAIAEDAALFVTGVAVRAAIVADPTSAVTKLRRAEDFFLACGYDNLPTIPGCD